MGYNITMLMLRPFLAVLICCLHTATPLSCYECTSMSGSCSETEWGTLTECPEDSVGCEITEVVSSSSYMPMFMRHCTNQGEIACETIEASHTCICAGEGCNKSWETAGEETSAPPDTTQGSKLKYYRCESKEDDCTEEDPGESVECEESNGCLISRTTLGDTTAMIRDCDNRVDAGCDTIVHGENNRTTEYCTCTSSLCNGDWVSAGATPSSTSPSPTAPSTTAPTPTSPSTTAPSTSTPAPALSYRNIVLIPVIVTHFLTM